MSNAYLNSQSYTRLNTIDLGLLPIVNYTGGDSLADSGKFVLFNDAGNAVLNIPDGLAVGSSVVVGNTGGGNIVLTPVTDTIRGALTLGDVAGYLAVTKISTTVWQSSERA